MSRFRPRNRSYWLAQLCEANFRQLSELVPDIASLPHQATANAPGKPPLFLKVVERSPYTVTVELSHCFRREIDGRPETSVCIRVYLDGKCAEALPCPQPRSNEARKDDAAQNARVLEEKWASNYFLQRWLEHCLRSRYRFALVAGAPEQPALA